MVLGGGDGGLETRLYAELIGFVFVCLNCCRWLVILDVYDLALLPMSTVETFNVHVISSSSINVSKYQVDKSGL